MSFKETMTSQETEEEYHFDEMYDRPNPQTFYNDIPTFDETHQEECYSTDNYDPLIEYFWDNLWHIEGASFSQLICNPEVEVWSICNPEDEEFFELIINKNIDPSVNYDTELDLHEQISSDEQILSDEAKRILERPINYSYINEEQDSCGVHNMGSFQPVMQPLVSKGSATSHFPLFSSVGAIMDMLNSMPSLKQKHVYSSPGPHCDLTPRSMLQVEMPGVALVNCRTHLRTGESVSVLPSRVGAVRPGAMMPSRRGRPLLYNSSFGPIRPGCKLYCSKQGLSLLISCSTARRGPEIPMQLLIGHRIDSGCRTRRDGCTLFDPGG